MAIIPCFYSVMRNTQLFPDHHHYIIITTTLHISNIDTKLTNMPSLTDEMCLFTPCILEISTCSLLLNCFPSRFVCWRGFTWVHQDLPCEITGRSHSSTHSLSIERFSPLKNIQISNCLKTLNVCVFLTSINQTISPHVASPWTFFFCKFWTFLCSDKNHMVQGIGNRPSIILKLIVVCSIVRTYPKSSTSVYLLTSINTTVPAKCHEE